MKLFTTAFVDRCDNSATDTGLLCTIELSDDGGGASATTTTHLPYLQAADLGLVVESTIEVKILASASNTYQVCINL